MIFTQFLEWVEVDSVALVKSLGDIPRSLPLPEIPDLGLLQAAGVAQRFPNADGSDPDDSRDFLAQGVGNITNGFFQSMPGGGSLSGTALLVAAGGRSRWAIVIQAPMILVLVLVFSDLLSLIPMAALAALLVYSASLSIKFSAIATVANTTRASNLTMLITFVATLLIPLQQAVLLGVVLAAVLFLYRSSTDIRVVQIEQRNGDVIEHEPSVAVPSWQVTVLDIYGSLFYAGAKTVGQRLPSARDSDGAVVILRMRGHGDVGSTFLNVVGRYATQLKERGGELLLSGVDPAVKERLGKTGHLETIGEGNVFVAGDILGHSTRAAFAAGQAWLERARPTTTAGPASDHVAVNAARSSNGIVQEPAPQDA